MSPYKQTGYDTNVLSPLHTSAAALADPARPLSTLPPRSEPSLLTVVKDKSFGESYTNHEMMQRLDSQQHEMDAMRAEIAALSSHNSIISAQMASLLTRLDGMNIVKGML